MKLSPLQQESLARTFHTRSYCTSEERSVRQLCWKNDEAMGLSDWDLKVTVLPPGQRKEKRAQLNERFKFEADTHGGIDTLLSVSRTKLFIFPWPMDNPIGQWDAWPQPSRFGATETRTSYYQVLRIALP